MTAVRRTLATPDVIACLILTTEGRISQMPNDGLPITKHDRFGWSIEIRGIDGMETAQAPFRGQMPDAPDHSRTAPIGYDELSLLVQIQRN